MKTLYEMRNYIQEQIEDDSNPTLVDSWINRAIETAASRWKFAEYTITKTVTPDVNGAFYVPANFQGVELIYPTDETFSKFMHHTPQTRHGNRVCREYWMWGTKRSADGATASISVTNGMYSITSTGLFTGAVSGDIIRFGTDSTEYEVNVVGGANTASITPFYRGAATTATVYLRPEGTKQIKLYDSTDSAYTSSVVLVYNTKPRPLYNDNDRLDADIAEIVEYGTLIEAYRNEKYMVDGERLKQDYMTAAENCLNSQKAPFQQKIPEGIKGGLPAFSLHTNRSAKNR